jgi:hypothetical protein
MTDAPHGSPDDTEAADLFRRLADGELDLESPEAQAWFTKHPLAAEEIRSLLGLDTELRASRITVDPAVADAPEPWPGADAAVANVVLQHLGTGPRAMPRRRWWPLALVAAAAIPLLLLVLPRSCFGEDPESGRPMQAEPDLQLGDSRLWPAGTASRAEFATRGFDWSRLPDLPATATFEVEVHTPDGRIVRSPPLRDRSWLPVPEVLAALPADLVWHLRATSPGRTIGAWKTATSLR